MFLRKIIFLEILIFTIFAFILWKVFELSVIEHKLPPSFKISYAKFKDIKRERGVIYLEDKNGLLVPAAINRGYYKIWVNGYDFKNEEDFENFKKVLFEIFKNQGKLQKAVDIIEKIKNEKRYIVVADSFFDGKSFFDEVRSIFEKNNIKFSVEKYFGRFYPFGESFSQVIGFVGYNGNKKEGLYGIEKYYNEYLEGEEHNYDVVLTLEPNVSKFSEEVLKKLVEKFSAEAGLLVVMDPKDGKIIGFSSFPSFDPNKYYKVKDYSLFLNPLVSGLFEPGSIFKIFVYALGFYYRAIQENEEYIDKGYVKEAGYVIKNAGEKVYGKIPLKYALAKSINTGAMYVVDKIKDEDYIRGIENFGFSDFTNIDLPYEAKGNILNLYSGRKIDKFVSSFGQGISLTPIEIITATASLINGGKILQPHFLDKIMLRNEVLFKYKNKIKRRVLDDYSRNIIKDWMKEVVEIGTAKRAKISGYKIGAKTGTAQIPLKNKKGYSDEVIHSVIGFGPYKDPKFLVFIKLVKPKEAKFADQTVVPALREIFEYLFYYYEIEPES